ncbi:MAG TPA: IS256 family transposase [Candidatus Obscuribacter sp.]|nr:IS256 family transposase [Candidatus Obscuribacter sp.]
MNKKTRKETDPSRVTFEGLEQFARAEIQKRLQELLEEELVEFLGRDRSERRAKIDEPRVYRNGHAKPRKLTMSVGTVELKRPRLRGQAELEKRFESRLLPLFVKRTQEVQDVIPELYLHGLAEADFDMALRGLLGDDAPLSASTVARMKEKWNTELEEWKQRPISDDIVYLWVDGVYVKAGLEKTKAALLVVLGAKSDGTKEILSVVAGHRESTESWAAVLRDLKARGMNCPRLVIGDGHLGIWAGLRNVFPDAEEQRCWNHKILNVLDKVPKKQQNSARLLLRQIPFAETKEDANTLRNKFTVWCEKKQLDDAARILANDWDRMVAFYSFPKGHWQHIRTSNPIESPFAALRLRTDAAKRYKKVENASAVIWKMLMVVQKKFRRLKAPELLKDVLAGKIYVNGLEKKEERKRSEEAA